MVESLIYLLVLVALFIGAAWGALWLINNFLPAPWLTAARVIVGLIFLIILLLFVAKFFGEGGGGKWFPGPKRALRPAIWSPVTGVQQPCTRSTASPGCV